MLRYTAPGRWFSRYVNKSDRTSISVSLPSRCRLSSCSVEISDGSDPDASLIPAGGPRREAHATSAKIVRRPAVAEARVILPGPGPCRLFLPRHRLEPRSGGAASLEKRGEFHPPGGALPWLLPWGSPSRLP